MVTTKFLSDPFISGPLAFPPVTTIFSVTIQDSVGCQMVTDCDVFVNPSSVPETLPVGFSARVIPNPIDKSSALQFDNPDFESLEIEVFNSIGVRILNLTTSRNSFEIGSLIDKSGEYFYQISSDGKISSSGRFTCN